MIQLCYMKFFAYCEDSGFVVTKNKYSKCSLNICLKRDMSKFIPFPLNKHPFTPYDLEFFLLAFKKYKLFSFNRLIEGCQKRVTDECPIDKYFKVFPHTMELNNHCPGQICSEADENSKNKNTNGKKNKYEIDSQRKKDIDNRKRWKYSNRI